jgi:hypothetical protein
VPHIYIHKNSRNIKECLVISQHFSFAFHKLYLPQNAFVFSKIMGTPPENVKGKVIAVNDRGGL